MIYERIESVCELKGLTLGGLAAKIGITRAGLYRMIEQKSMKVETLEKIAGVLGVPITEFFDGVEIYSPEVVNDLENELLKLNTFLFESFRLFSVIQHKTNKAAKNPAAFDSSIIEDIEELSQIYTKALQPIQYFSIHGETGKLKDRSEKMVFSKGHKAKTESDKTIKKGLE